MDHKYWPLDDWVKMLEVASKGISSLKNCAKAGEVAMPDSSESTSALQHSVPLQVKLIKDLHHLSAFKSTTKMLLNIQTAALHMSYMLKGSDPDNKLVS